MAPLNSTSVITEACCYKPDVLPLIQSTVSLQQLNLTYFPSQTYTPSKVHTQLSAVPYCHCDKAVTLLLHFDDGVPVEPGFTLNFQPQFVLEMKRWGQVTEISNVACHSRHLTDSLKALTETHSNDTKPQVSSHAFFSHHQTSQEGVTDSRVPRISFWWYKLN